MCPGLEINGLFRDIRIPDQHELGEPQVGPENRKGKHELTDIMQVLIIGVLQVVVIFQEHNK